MKFFPEFLTEYPLNAVVSSPTPSVRCVDTTPSTAGLRQPLSPLDRPESILAWKDYLEEKQGKFEKICHDIETIDYPYFVYAEEQKEKLGMSKAKIFFTKAGIDDENISMLDIAEIMQKHWRGWYSENDDILTQVAFLDLQYGLMEGNIFICNNCRKLFLRPERGPEPSFCSSRCQNQYYYRKRR